MHQPSQYHLKIYSNVLLFPLPEAQPHFLSPKSHITKMHLTSNHPNVHHPIAQMPLPTAQQDYSQGNTQLLVWRVFLILNRMVCSATGLLTEQSTQSVFSEQKKYFNHPSHCSSVNSKIILSKCDSRSRCAYRQTTFVGWMIRNSGLHFGDH